MENINLVKNSPIYKGVKVTSMIKAIKSREIKRHLRKSQKDWIDSTDNTYRTLGYLTKREMIIVWKFYLNFVLRDFRY